MTDLKERVSPYAEHDAARAASARKYNDLRNQLRLAFRPAQQEAAEQWETLMEEQDQADTADPST